MTQSPAPITQADVLKYIGNGQDDDFLFELEIYRQFKGSATHAGTYEDPVLGKRRQYDIRAIFSTLEDGVSRLIRLAVECKNVRAPLLLLRVPRSPDDSFHQYMFKVDEPRGYGPENAREFTCAVSETLRRVKSIYPAGEQVAKSVQQIRRNTDGNLEKVKKDADDDVYDKWAQAIASADGLVRQAEIDNRFPLNPRIHTFILPVLVVPDDMLWVADYDEDGKLKADPCRVATSTFFVGHRIALLRSGYPTYTISHLHMYTQQGLIDFLAQLSKPDPLWKLIFNY